MNDKKIHNWIEKEIETEAAAQEQDADENVPATLHMTDDSADDLMRRIHSPQSPKRPRFRIRPRVLAATAAAASLVIILGIGTNGARLFTPEVQDRAQNEEFNMQIISGDNTYLVNVTEEEAYAEIEERIGIQALRLGYKPQGMELVRTFVDEEMREAQMEFSYGEQILTIYENKQGENASFNVRNDGENVGEIEVFHFGKGIAIVQTDKGNGSKFYTSQIEQGDSYYYICGDMDIEQFKEILSEIFFKSI